MMHGFLPRPSRSPSMADVVAKACFEVPTLLVLSAVPAVIATLLFSVLQFVGLSVGYQEDGQ